MRLSLVALRFCMASALFWSSSLCKFDIWRNHRLLKWRWMEALTRCRVQRQVVEVRLFTELLLCYWLTWSRHKIRMHVSWHLLILKCLMIGYLGLAVQNRNQHQTLWRLKVAILWRLRKCRKCLSLILCLSKTIVARSFLTCLNLASRLLCSPKVHFVSKDLSCQLIN